MIFQLERKSKSKSWIGNEVGHIEENVGDFIEMLGNLNQKVDFIQKDVTSSVKSGLILGGSSSNVR